MVSVSKIKEVFLMFGLFCSISLSGQVPNNIIPLAQDPFSITIDHGSTRNIDSVKYSNGVKLWHQFDELDNRTSGAEIPALPKAELRVPFANLPDSLGINTQNIFDVIWRNSGPLLADNVRVQAFWSIDSLWSSSDVSAGITYKEDLMPPSAEEIVATAVNVPSNLNPNQHYWLLFYIDDNLMIEEYSDSNNILAVKVYITPCGSYLGNPIEVRSAVCDRPNGGASIQLPEGFSVEWENGLSDTSINNLSAGFYTYEITEEVNRCVWRDSFEVVALPNLQVDFEVTDESCGKSNGSINANPISGQSPYTYSWNTGETGSSLTGLDEGFYTVAIADSLGCQDVFNIHLESSPKPFAQVDVFNATCGLANGSATVEVSQGQPTYGYAYYVLSADTTELINGASGNPYIINLAAGYYNVVVTDASIHKCKDTVNFQIVNTNLLEVQINAYGDYLIADVTTGTNPFMYEWSTGATTQSIEPSDTGLYYVDVYDGNGCYNRDSFYISPDTTTGIDESLALDGQFFVFPNPNNGKAVVAHIGKEDVEELIIYSIQGQFVYKQQLDGSPKGEVHLEYIFSSGTYIMMARDNKGDMIASSKFIVF